MYGAFEDFKDCIYEDACEIVKDEIYEDLLNEIKDYYYEGIINDAKDDVQYSDWSDARGDAYSWWSDVRGEEIKGVYQRSQHQVFGRGGICEYTRFNRNAQAFGHSIHLRQ